MRYSPESSNENPQNCTVDGVVDFYASGSLRMLMLLARSQESNCGRAALGDNNWPVTAKRQEQRHCASKVHRRGSVGIMEGGCSSIISRSVIAVSSNALQP